MRTNVKTVTEHTHEGAAAGPQNAVKALRRSVMANMLFENEFYEDGEEIAKRIQRLVGQVSFADAAQCAIDARERFKLRHVPLLVVREMLRHKEAGRKMGDLIARVVQRPDEMGELLSLYWKDGKDQPLTAQLKIGLARALKKFNEYSLAKYRGEGAAVTLKDVLFLAHPRPASAEQQALFDRIVKGELATPDTWETQLSAGADKKATFERLILERKLGGLALLRNLRGMLEAGVDSNIIWQAIATMRTDRILPFRFLSAAKYGKQFEPVLEQAMFRCLAEQPKIAGKTALLIDHSGSMEATVSGKSEISRLDAACAVGIILREVCDRARVFVFSDSFAEVAPRRGFGLVDAVKGSMHPSSTYLGAAVKRLYEVYPDCERLIIVTDEQSADRPQHPRGKGYIVNVASARNGIGYGPWTSIDGWSEAVVDFIREMESEEVVSVSASAD